MQIPLSRSDGTAFDPLWRRFAQQLDRWPDFVPAPPPPPDVLPAVDVLESDQAYLVEVELPGVRQDDVRVELAGSRLVVTGRRRSYDRQGLFRHRSRRTGHLRLAVTLPGELAANDVAASLEDGLLTVLLPKAVSSRPRRIPVSVGPRG